VGHAAENAGAAEWDDGALVAALRAGDERAARELVLRFRPYLLAVARGAGVPAAERETLAVDTLVDACAVLADARRVVPRRLAAYLGTALRRRWLTICRAERRRQRHGERAAELEPHEGESGLVAGACSEWARRASRGDAEEPPPLPPALQRLAAVMADGLSEEERLMLAWLGHHVPQRLVAEWLGIGHAAAAKRIERLRQRLRGAAVAHAATLDAGERRVLLGFFRRAGTPLADSGVRSPRRARAPGAPMDGGSEEQAS
jgi:DNA-directed RNA polymerase specialized sigma24 family protein